MWRSFKAFQSFNREMCAGWWRDGNDKQCDQKRKQSGLITDPTSEVGRVHAKAHVHRQRLGGVTSGTGVLQIP